MKSLMKEVAFIMARDHHYQKKYNLGSLTKTGGESNSVIYEGQNYLRKMIGEFLTKEFGRMIARD